MRCCRRIAASHNANQTCVGRRIFATYMQQELIELCLSTRNLHKFYVRLGWFKYHQIGHQIGAMNRTWNAINWRVNFNVLLYSGITFVSILRQQYLRNVHMACYNIRRFVSCPVCLGRYFFDIGKVEAFVFGYSSSQAYLWAA